ncbi:MAG: alpha-mannosidase, partial [Oscillospiraceae bacterium]|nr:alpha-mannosidase [Oscillospiraceae bacterium]
ANARRYMQENYYAKREGMTPIAIADSIGHTHIDVAWLWDIEQSRHKAIRSFSTVCDLMDRYPEYRFMSSQPILYEFVKEDEPELYERIKARVAEGRWEVEGGMWVEADCNISGGEALARQFLYGQRFFSEEFGKRCKVLWLPDVFGYSAALPQLMKLCGIDYFMTTKISWNEYNKMPYDTFSWKGIDGTQVLTHFSPVRDYYSTNIGEGHHRHSDIYTTYTSIMNPSEIAGGWKRFMQKGLDDHFLVLYGYGDGGGGTTDAMIERARRMSVPMPLTPVVQQEFALPFFEKLSQRVWNDAALPVWSGELYLEYHRGTYTSQARNKKFNRRAESALRRAELRCLQSGLRDKKTLDEVWHDVLTLQFHDILPGSSIHKVYEDSDKMYAQCFEKLDNIDKQAEKLLLEECEYSLCVFNDLDFERSDFISFKSDKSVGSIVDESGRNYMVYQQGEDCMAYVESLRPLAASNFRLSDAAFGRVRLTVDKDGFDTP